MVWAGLENNDVKKRKREKKHQVTKLIFFHLKIEKKINGKEKMWGKCNKIEVAFQVNFFFPILTSKQQG